MKQTLDDMLLEFRGYLFKCHRLMKEIDERLSKYEEFSRRINKDENNGREE